MTAAGLFAGLAVLYFLCRPENHLVDTVLYALGTEVKDAYMFFHWHHLLYTPLNWVIWHAVRGMGVLVTAFTTMSALSALAAAGAAACIYLALRRWGADFWGALLATLGAATAATWWYFAGEGEVLACISFFMAGGLFLISGGQTSNRRAILTGVWLGIGILFHQTLVIFTLLAAVLWALSRRRVWPQPALLVGTAALIAAAAYFFIPVFYYQVRSPYDWFRWTTAYFWWGDWGKVARSRLVMGCLCFLGSFVAGPFSLDAGARLPWSEILRRYLPAALSAAAILGLIASGIKGLWRNHRPLLIVAIGWVILYHAFFTWWEAENCEWWIATTIPLWLLAGLVPKRRFVNCLWGAGLAAIAVLNLLRLIIPATVPGKNAAEMAGRDLVAASDPGDAIFISHVDAWAWTDYIGHHERNLLLPFNKPDPGFEEKLERQARTGFRKLGGELYFTDYEWDEPSLGAAPNAGVLKAIFFRMIYAAQPITTTRLPGRAAVIYRFTGYDETLTAIRIYEPPDIYPGSGVVLDKKGGRTRFAVVIPEPGKYTVCVDARTDDETGPDPRMRIEIDGYYAGTVKVDTPYPAFYELDYVFEDEGRHMVDFRALSKSAAKEGPLGKAITVHRIIQYRR